MGSSGSPMAHRGINTRAASRKTLVARDIDTLHVDALLAEVTSLEGLVLPVLTYSRDFNPQQVRVCE